LREYKRHVAREKRRRKYRESEEEPQKAALFLSLFWSETCAIFLTTTGDGMASKERTLSSKIMRKARSYEPGSRVFTPRDFFSLGSSSGVYKALSRLVSDGRLRRVGRGLYDIPADNPLLAKPAPASVDAVLDALRRAHDAVIIPDHAAAANAMGLTTALPVRPVFVANRRLSRIVVSGRPITFKIAGRVLEPWLETPAVPIVQSFIWLREGGYPLGEAAEIIRKRASPTAKRALARHMKLLPAWAKPAARDIVSHAP
jgi:hypothetical protein